MDSMADASDACVFCVAKISPETIDSERDDPTQQISSDIPNLGALCRYLRITVPSSSSPNILDLPCNKFLCLSCFESVDFLKELYVQLEEVKKKIKDAKTTIKGIIIDSSAIDDADRKEADFVKIFGDNVKLAFGLNVGIIGDMTVKQEQEDEVVETFDAIDNGGEIQLTAVDVITKLDPEGQKNGVRNQICSSSEDEKCSSSSDDDSDEETSQVDGTNTDPAGNPDQVLKSNEKGAEVTVTSRSLQNSITRQAKQFQCPLCKKSYDRVRPFAHHIAKQHSDKSSEGLVDTGNLGNNRKVLLTNKIKEKEEKLSLRAQSEVVVDGKTVLECPHCRKRYERVKSLRNHIARNHAPEFKAPRTYSCSQCPSRTFRYETSLQRHMFAAHTTGPKFKCEKCDKAYHSRQYLKHHIKSDHEGVRYPCPQCSKDFGDTARLKQHVRLVHTGEGLHECQICGKKYVMPSDLRNHVIKHDENATKQYICDICGKEFITLERLRGHRYHHQAVRKHQCPHCPQTFKEPRHLVHHIRRHTGEKPFKCPICQRPFAQKVAMEAHVRTHQKQRSQKPHTRPNKKKPPKMEAKNS